MGQSNSLEWWAGLRLGHVNKIPTMQFFTEIPRNTQSKSYYYCIYAIIDWVCLRFPK